MIKFSLLLLSCLLICIAENYNGLSFSHISPQKISGRFQPQQEDDYGVLFESREYSLHLENLQGRTLLDIDSFGERKIEVLGTNYPKDATKATNANVFLQTESKLLPVLYHSMAALGIKGPEMPGVMGLYKIALGIQKYTTKFITRKMCDCDCPEAIHDMECRTGGRSPPQCCDCLGQCGPCGTCWSAVCGDCCWWVGCCGHDICCYDEFSIDCLLPITFGCNSLYTCSGFNTTCCTRAPNTWANTCRVEDFGCTCGTGACCTGGWKC